MSSNLEIWAFGLRLFEMGANKIRKSIKSRRIVIM